MKALIAIFVLGLFGCASADPRPMARDPVCLAKGDLGCVNVRVDERTPRAVHGGVTYYFCAERCRVEFEKDPGRYASAQSE